MAPTHAEALSVLSAAGLRAVICSPLDNCGRDSARLYRLEKPSVSFPPLVSFPENETTTNAFGVPTMTQWHTIWHTWDVITLGMIPQDMLHVQPIDLRHRCLFYLGHLPT
jgi:hypothetical protein